MVLKFDREISFWQMTVLSFWRVQYRHRQLSTMLVTPIRHLAQIQREDLPGYDIMLSYQNASAALGPNPMMIRATMHLYPMPK